MEITDEWTQLDTNTWIELASIRGRFLLFFGRGYAALLASIQGCSLLSLREPVFRYEFPRPRSRMAERFLAPYESVAALFD